ncbi:hypothetical protein [Methylomonas sp. MK1]|uniref:hypothetical protein n=1 Tax=Methylomonas sp. MK1 TaxID=1131552 RepID=UPI00036A173D|nr:hypothetical protein [Methylomonas sp. MK1]
MTNGFKMFSLHQLKHRLFSALLTYLLIILFSSLVIYYFIEFISSMKFFLSNDTYFEEALNFIHGRGLTRTPWAAGNPTVDYEPNIYQPPGFGLLIYLVSLFGLIPTKADLWISYISWALTPAILVFLLKPLIGLRFSIFCAILSVTSPCYYLFGSGPFTEALYTAIILLSIGIVIRNLNRDLDRKLIAAILCAGFVAGVAYSVRNACLAYFAALFFTFVTLRILGSIKTEKALTLLLWFFIGSAPVLIALHLRNLSVFNQILPYRIDQGYFSTYLTSVRVLIEALLFDFIGSRTIAKIAWDFWLILLVFLPVSLSGLYLTWKQWVKYTLETKFFILFAVLFLLASSGMLIIAHTRHGLDPGNLIRHVFPFTWVLYPLALITFNFEQNRFRNIFSAVLGGLILFSHLNHMRNDIQKTQEVLAALNQPSDIATAARAITGKYKIITEEINFKITQDPEIIGIIDSIPKNALVISNVGGLLRRLTLLPIRSFDFDARKLQETALVIGEMANNTLPGRPFYLVILPNNETVRVLDAGDWKESIAKSLIPQGFVVTASKNNIIVFLKSDKS